MSGHHNLDMQSLPVPVLNRTVLRNINCFDVHACYDMQARKVVYKGLQGNSIANIVSVVIN